VDRVRLVGTVVGGLLVVWLLLAYLLSPIDLVPDFVPVPVPVLGYADDVVVVAWGLRSVVRRAGSDALTLHWPGEPAGLAVVSRLAGIRAG
jgi:uncharacterized membrane protein YkvA (DUF1232 family)